MRHFDFGSLLIEVLLEFGVDVFYLGLFLVLRGFQSEIFVIFPHFIYFIYRFHNPKI